MSLNGSRHLRQSPPSPRLSELELESLIDPSSPRAAAQRTTSGSQLISRSRRSPSPTNESCEHKSGRIARAALSRSRSAAKRVLRHNRSTVSCGALSLLVTAVLSIFFNGFEGSYLPELLVGSTDEKQSFGDPVASNNNNNNDSEDLLLLKEQQKQEEEEFGEKKQNQEKPRSTPFGWIRNPLVPAPVSTASPTNIPTQSPTFRPTAAPVSSIDVETRASATVPKYHHTGNSTSTWLDFSSFDSSPTRSQLPRLGDAKEFVQRWCNVDRTTWWPPPGDWRLRAPSFLIPGASFSGTEYLAAALHTHPSVAPARTVELKFFMDRQFKNYMDVKSERTLVHAARERMYANQFPAKRALQTNTSLVSFDATPGYLFFSTLTPRRILCVEPWVKLVLLLRHPVERVLEHYTYLRSNHRLTMSLEDVIRQELDLLRQLGWGNVTADTAEEDNVWYDYQSTSPSGILGRSLYAIQVRHWVQALRMVGRDPATEILLVPTESLLFRRDDTTGTAWWDRVLEFLHLPPQSLALAPPASLERRAGATPEVMMELEEFFAPYNDRLVELIRKYGLQMTGV